MYQTRQVPRFQYGFPQYSMPVRPTSYNQSGGAVTTGPGQPQPSPLQQYAPTIGNQLAKQGMNYANDQADQNAYNAALKNNFGVNDTDPRLISDTDRLQFGQEMGGTHPGYYTGPEGTAASNTALDAESPYAANNLQNGGLLADTGAPATAAPATDAAAGTTAGSTVGTGAAGAADTGAAGSGAAAATDTGVVADASSGLLGTDALVGGGEAAGAADAGLLGTGAAAGGEAAAGATAAEGTAAAVGATNFWNPVGWAALAGLAAYQMGLFD